MQLECCAGPGHPSLGRGVCMSSLNNGRGRRRAQIQRKWSLVLLEHPTATAGRKAHGWHSGWHCMSQLCPRSPRCPGNSTSPRDHTLGSGQDRSLPPYPESPHLPVNSLMQAWCKHPSLLAALSLWSLEEPRGGRNLRAACRARAAAAADAARAERFNHSFPRTFSSKQGLHCSACSLIFPLSLQSIPSFRLQTDSPASGWSTAEIITGSVSLSPLYQQPPSGQIKARKEGESERKG